ncbi:response regulator transcription factor [Paenibacillus senegalensis]|uniref:response regulator transcription factor n=1 Tax=Paenibacillus senegalensis TaxID=1465766 RepID=UPI000287C5D0|nr:response regulator transcription factor [Paenibacillus senegalensis]
MNATIEVIVVDDHPLIAQATKQLLQGLEGIEVIGVVHSGQACLDMIEHSKPGLVMLDYQLPDMPGSEVAKRVKAQYPDTHIVIFTGKEVEEFYNKLLDIPVSGIISKESGEHTIKSMVSAILDNHTVIPLSLFTRLRLISGEGALEEELTPEEIKIMNLIVSGYTHEQVAEIIHASKRSVDNYLKKIYKKLGVPSKVKAIEKYIQSPYYEEIRKED